jgi:hypothetical protein
LQTVNEAHLACARWRSRAEVLAWQQELEQTLAELEVQLVALQNPVTKAGKPAKPSGVKITAQEVEIAWTKFLLERVPFALKRLERQIDLRLLRAHRRCGRREPDRG